MGEILKQFLKTEAFSSLLLLLSAIIAIIWANSPLEVWHQKFIESSLFWINEGFMTLFFLLVGLELKREFTAGVLSDRSQILLPFIAALGGMLIPALIYFCFNYGDATTLKGWASPVATDIAFALGVLLLFEKRVPIPLKIFLLALAIFDDIGAIIIIIFFYTQTFAKLWLLFSIILVLLLYFLNRINIHRLFPYFLLGILLWFTLLKTGIHPTIAGILIAMMIPDGATDVKTSLLTKLETKLHPWVAYLIMPLFALANAGISLSDITFYHLIDKVVLGIALSLFIGKQIGVFGFSYLLIKSGMAKLPQNTSWMSLYGVAILCGIGFTMSLFLGTLSFQNQPLYLAEVRLGVIIGSVLSGVIGALVLSVALAKQNN